MNVLEKINVTISLYFEVKDSEMFGGVGKIGYTEVKADLEVEDLSNIKIQDFAEDMIAGYAEMFKVPKEMCELFRGQSMKKIWRNRE